MIYVTMVYGPIAAFLVELFPTRIRYTSMSLPYHIGNGWFGGFLPLIATAVTPRPGRGDVRRGVDLHRPHLPDRGLSGDHHRLGDVHHRDQGSQDRRAHQDLAPPRVAAIGGRGVTRS